MRPMTMTSVRFCFWPYISAISSFVRNMTVFTQTAHDISDGLDVIFDHEYPSFSERLSSIVLSAVEPRSCRPLRPSSPRGRPALACRLPLPGPRPATPQGAINPPHPRHASRRPRAASSLLRPKHLEVFTRPLSRKGFSRQATRCRWRSCGRVRDRQEFDASGAAADAVPTNH